MKTPYLIIHAQQYWHTEAFICGNLEGLQILKEVVEKAIAEQQAAKCVFNVDGEGYAVMVIQNNTEELKKLDCGYADTECYSPPPKSIHPSELLGKDGYKELYFSAVTETEEKYAKEENENS